MTEHNFDIILITGENYADHPSNAAGILKRFMEHHGFATAVISKPDWSSDADFQQYGTPRLFFGITSGAIDSMLLNYTSLKRPRKDDPNTPFDSGVPDRAVTVYANKVRQLFKTSRIVLGGVEASLRRFAHYDFWQNRVRPSILFDTRADILVYGPGEYPLLEIASRLRQDPAADLEGIASTCIIAKELPAGFKLLPSHEETAADTEAFTRAQQLFKNSADLAQQFQNRYALQYRMRELTSAELDSVYDLPFTRTIPEYAAELEMFRFSVVTHRGCIGRCSFCSLALLQGDRIVSRTEASILAEIKRMTAHPAFKGYVDDLGGPSANMYGMDCENSDCKAVCMTCKDLDRTNVRLIRLLQEARSIKGVKKVFVRSGIRFDLASDAYLKELSLHHISGTLKIAPEHFSKRVLAYMNKDYGDFNGFCRKFNTLNKDTGQELRYYLMVAHPGATMQDLEIMRRKVTRLRNTESIQIFVPLPMTVSACMYHTGRDPFTGEELYVARTFREKKERRNIIQQETRKKHRKKH